MVFDTFKRSNFVSLALGLDRFGSLSLGLVDQTSWGDAVSTKQIQLGYGVSLDRVGLFASLGRTVFSDDRPHVDALSLSATVPLNLGSWNGSLRAGADQTTGSPVTRSLSFNSGASGELFDKFNYGLTTSSTNGENSAGAFASYQHP